MSFHLVILLLTAASPTTASPTARANLMTRAQRYFQDRFPLERVTRVESAYAPPDYPRVRVNARTAPTLDVEMGFVMLGTRLICRVSLGATRGEAREAAFATCTEIVGAAPARNQPLKEAFAEHLLRTEGIPFNFPRVTRYITSRYADVILYHLGLDRVPDVGLTRAFLFTLEDTDADRAPFDPLGASVLGRATLIFARNAGGPLSRVVRDFHLPLWSCERSLINHASMPIYLGPERVLESDLP